MKRAFIVPLGRLKKRISAISKMIRIDRVSVYAAETAFFIILSAVPFLMLTVTVAGYIVDGNVDYYLSLIATYIPGVIGDYVEAGMLAIVKRPMSLSFSVVATFWSASKGIRAARRGVRSVYGESADSFLREALTGLIFTAVFVVLIIAVLVFFVFGDALVNLLAKLIPSIHGIVSLTVALFPIIFTVILIFVFAFVLRAFTPAVSGVSLYRQHLPGAALASVGWLAYSYIFSLFIAEFSSMPAIYGSLSVIMILMIWIYMIMYIFLIGAEFNKYLYMRKQKK